METVTARLVGMEINASSSVTSPPGKASEDAHLQMAKSVATEVRHPFMLLQTQWLTRIIMIKTYLLNVFPSV